MLEGIGQWLWTRLDGRHTLQRRYYGDRRACVRGAAPLFLVAGQREAGDAEPLPDAHRCRAEMDVFTRAYEHRDLGRVLVTVPHGENSSGSGSENSGSESGNSQSTFTTTSDLYVKMKVGYVADRGLADEGFTAHLTPATTALYISHGACLREGDNGVQLHCPLSDAKLADGNSDGKVAAAMVRPERRVFHGDPLCASGTYRVDGFTNAQLDAYEPQCVTLPGDHDPIARYYAYGAGGVAAALLLVFVARRLRKRKKKSSGGKAVKGKGKGKVVSGDEGDDSSSSLGSARRSGRSKRRDIENSGSISESASVSGITGERESVFCSERTAMLAGNSAESRPGSGRASYLYDSL